MSSNPDETKQYTYEIYTNIHERLNGRTFYYSDGVLLDLKKPLLAESEFHEQMALLHEINSFEPEGPDDMEAIIYAIRDIKSDLFLLERLNPFHEKG